MFNFKIITAYDEYYKEIGDMTLVNKQRYAEKWGYDVIKIDLTKSHKPTNWEKINALLNNMTESGDWLFWSDADSLIMNFTIPLESFICPDIDFVFGFHMVDKDTNEYYPHSGNFFIKDTALAKDFLKKAWERFEYDNKERMMEEVSFRTILTTYPEFGERTYYVMLNRLCSVPHVVTYTGVVGFPEYKAGNFINHFMTPLSKEERIRMINEYKDMVTE